MNDEEFDALLDKYYPGSKLTIPQQFCKQCDVKKTSEVYFPYCSAQCARASRGKR